MRAVAMALVLATLAACADWSGHDGSPGETQVLQSNLSVASAALAAGQPGVARRLYLSLAERFADLPEPVLGLGYLDLQANNLAQAKKHFVRAAALAGESPAIRVDALLGAGRASLAQGETGAARQYLEQARALAEDPASIAWIENGLAVAAAQDADFESAHAHYATALRQSSRHPRITANFVRMLIASGRLDEAARVYEAHDQSYWQDRDGQALQRLLDDDRRQHMSTAGPDPRLMLLWPAMDPSPLLSRAAAHPAVQLQLAGPAGLMFSLAGGASPVMARAVNGTYAAFEPSDAPVSAPAVEVATVPAPSTRPLAERRTETGASLRMSEAVLQDAPALDAWTVVLGRSRQLHLNSAAQTVAAASPDIADVQLLAPDVLYIVGKSVGSTTVSVLSEKGYVHRQDVWVVLDVEPLRALLAREAEFEAVHVEGLTRGVVLSGAVDSGETAERASRLAAAWMPEGMVVENNIDVSLDLEPLRTVLAKEAEFSGVQVEGLARGVVLTGTVASAEAVERALRLATASMPEGMLAESNLQVGPDLQSLRALMAAEHGFHGVRVKRVARGVALTGEVGSAASAERATRLAVAALPEHILVENNLAVVFDTEPLRRILASEPGLEGVSVQRLARGVALAGEVGSAAAADRALRLAAASFPDDTVLENNLHIAGPKQVNLEVQIAEVHRSVAEDIGFNWEAFGGSGDPLGFGFRIGRSLPGVGQVGPARLDGLPDPIPGDIPRTAVDGLVSPSFIVQRAWDNIGITGVLDVLAKAGLANVLARPNVTANSGETASFFSGGEYPLPSGFEDGVIAFEYKKYGVLLDFVPTIIGDGTIELTVRPEVSEPSQSQSVQVITGVNVPVINVRRAETTVELGDGESIVIAGLFRSATNNVEAGVPLMKDLPLLGGLFGHTSTRSDELELIVTITARLVDAGPAPESSSALLPADAGDYYY